MSILLDGWAILLRPGSWFPALLLFCLAAIALSAWLGPPDHPRYPRNVTPRRKQLGPAETRLRRWR